MRFSAHRVRSCTRERLPCALRCRALPAPTLFSPLGNALRAMRMAARSTNINPYWYLFGRCVTSLQMLVFPLHSLVAATSTDCACSPRAAVHQILSPAETVFDTTLLLAGFAQLKPPGASCSSPVC